jgi:biotin-dependent carboxylase-like uncharacterized protein
MTARRIDVLSAGPAVSVQDAGRRGHLAKGVSVGGAVDPRALAEGAALLRQSADCAVLEMAGMGGRFRTSAPVRIALTGAPLGARIDGEVVMWGSSHLLPAGAVLEVGAAHGGYGYLHIGGGIDTPPVLGARAAHLSTGLAGGRLVAGDTLPLGPDSGTQTGMTLPPDGRFSGGTLRFVAGPQTALFTAEDLERLQSIPFQRHPRSNRTGLRLAAETALNAGQDGLQVLSDVVCMGDIQITGEGTPLVLLNECQTIGGYPRIGTVLPGDIALAAQAAAGAVLRFRLVPLEEGIAAHRRWCAEIAALPSKVTPLVRDPASLPDLLSRQLIGGVVSAFD